MNLLDGLRGRAAAHPAHIVLSEGHDPRIVAGALAALDAGMGPFTLVGDAEKILAQLTLAGAENRTGIFVEDPRTSPLTPEFAQTYLELRKHKRISKDVAGVQAQNPLVFAAMMVRNGYAAGTIGGAVSTTSETLRAAVQIIGNAPGTLLVSSFFLMVLPDDHPSGRSAMIFSDCGLVIEPNAKELAAIAAASATSFNLLLGETPKIALLSFSTLGSARHPTVKKVSDALTILREQHPSLAADGELQFDAAFEPYVAAIKAPGSAVAGQANIFVFPNLDAGNIGYKIAQRIGGARAIGPVLQGLAKPANDLSRGCSAQDVTDMIAVTTLQTAI